MRNKQLALVQQMLPQTPSEFKAYVPRTPKAQSNIMIEKGALGQLVFRASPIWWKFGSIWQTVLQEGTMVLSYPPDTDPIDPPGWCYEEQLKPKPFEWGARGLLYRVDQAIDDAKNQTWVLMQEFRKNQHYYSTTSPLVRKLCCDQEIYVGVMQSQRWRVPMGWLNFHLIFARTIASQHQSLIGTRIVKFAGITKDRS